MSRVKVQTAANIRAKGRLYYAQFDRGIPGTTGSG